MFFYSMHNVGVRYGFPIAAIWSLRKTLEVLDVSDIPESNVDEESEASQNIGIPLVEAFSGDRSAAQMEGDDVRRKMAKIDLHEDGPSNGALQNLQILDLSGVQANFDSGIFSGFLRNHGKLEFLGLLLTNAGVFPDVVRLTRVQVTQAVSMHRWDSR